MLQLHNLTVGYRGRCVAHSLCASLPEATLTALIGRNGSGKSTLLRSICGLQRPLGGSVTLCAADGTSLGVDPATVSVVLTARPSAPALTVADTVALGRLPYTGLTGRLGKRDHEAVERAIEACSIDSLRHRNLGSLSDGERQRVMLARALAQDTPVIVLDEPTAFLDYSARVQAVRLLRRLCTQQRKTILFSTHDLETALPAVDSVWAMLPATNAESCATLRTGTAAELAADGTLALIFPEYAGGLPE